MAKPALVTYALVHPMQPAELRIAREALGLSTTALASYLGVTTKALQRWEKGSRSEGAVRIPDDIRDRVQALEAHTDAKVAAFVRKHRRGEPLITFRSDADFHALHPEERPMTAAWHRIVCARVLRELPHLTVLFARTTDDESVTPQRGTTVVRPLELGAAGDADD